jgi:hypothetical protein
MKIYRNNINGIREALAKKWAEGSAGGQLAGTDLDALRLICRFQEKRKGTLQCSFKKGEEVHTWISFRTGDFGFKANSVYTGLVKMK